VVVGCGILVRTSSCPTGVSSRQRGTTVEPHPPAQKRQFYLLWYYCRDIQLPNWSVLQIKRYHCGTTSTCAKAAILFAVVFLSGHPAAQLECPPDKEVPLWNHIHLRKRGNFICFGILVRASSSPTGVSSRQRGTTVEPHPPAQKRQFYWRWYSCPGIQQPNWSVLQTKRYHCGTTSTCAKAAILFSGILVRTLSSRVSVLQSESHHCGTTSTFAKGARCL
jgi:hypothetical protein